MTQAIGEESTSRQRRVSFTDPEDGAPAAEESVKTLNKQTLRNVCCFIASPDEEWYRAVHIVLHDQARDVVLHAYSEVLNHYSGLRLALMLVARWIGGLAYPPRMGPGS